MCERVLMVNMGQLFVSTDLAVALAALGLGSCVVACAYDPEAIVAGMIHVVLPGRAPTCDPGRSAEGPAKYAEEAVPLLLEELAVAGARRRRLRAALVGGANVLEAPDPTPSLGIGARNIAAVRVALEREGVAIAADDTGGRESRSVRLVVGTGEVVLKTLRGGERTLARLGGQR